MKQAIKFTTLALAVFGLFLISGCVTQNKQVLATETIFGFQLAANPNTGITGIIPQVQFGLIRNHYVSNPTSTNRVYAAPLTSHVSADLGLLSQTADEDETFGSSTNSP